jgi:hypothetical protein
VTVIAAVSIVEAVVAVEALTGTLTFLHMGPTMTEEAIEAGIEIEARVVTGTGKAIGTEIGTGKGIEIGIGTGMIAGERNVGTEDLRTGAKAEIGNLPTTFTEDRPGWLEQTGAQRRFLMGWAGSTLTSAH